MPKLKNIIRKIGVGLNAPQTALMDKLMTIYSQTEPSSFFANLLTYHDQLLNVTKRNPVGRPRKEDEQDEPLDTNVYYHPICLPLIPNDPNLKFATREEVDFYFSFRGLETPSDYFEKNIKK